MTGEPNPHGKPKRADYLREIDRLNAAVLAKKQSRILDLEAALKPFARAGELFASGGWPMSIYRPAAGEQYWLTSDDLVRAREAMGGEPLEGAEAHTAAAVEKD